MLFLYAPLTNFLKYLDDGSVTDDFTKEIDEAVREVRKDKIWRRKIMTVEQLIKDEAKLAHEAGYAEGMTAGEEKGIEQGIEQGVLSSIKNLMDSMKISASEAMDYLKIPEEQQAKYMEKI